MKTESQLRVGGICPDDVFHWSIRAFAVEGGLGRPISGMQIVPFAGVVPPEPGFAVLTGETYYDGSIGGGPSVPIAGLLVANVDMKAAFTPIGLLYIWPTPTKTWNFASVVNSPLAWVEVEASLSLGPFTVRKKESMFGLFDLAFTPIIASHHLAVRLIIWLSTSRFGLQLDPTKKADWSTRAQTVGRLFPAWLTRRFFRGQHRIEWHLGHGVRHRRSCHHL